MRWNRSRGTPAAAATTALMGSAWETATIALPGVGAHAGEGRPRCRGRRARRRTRRRGSGSRPASAAPSLHSGVLARLLRPGPGPGRRRRTRSGPGPCGPAARAPGRWAPPSLSCARAARRRRPRAWRPARRSARRPARPAPGPRRPGAGPGPGPGSTLAGGRGLTVPDQEDQGGGRGLLGRRHGLPS